MSTTIVPSDSALTRFAKVSAISVDGRPLLSVAARVSLTMLPFFWGGPARAAPAPPPIPMIAAASVPLTDLLTSGAECGAESRIRLRRRQPPEQPAMLAVRIPRAGVLDDHAAPRRADLEVAPVLGQHRGLVAAAAGHRPVRRG